MSDDDLIRRGDVEAMTVRVYGPGSIGHVRNAPADPVAAAAIRLAEAVEDMHVEAMGDRWIEARNAFVAARSNYVAVKAARKD